MGLFLFISEFVENSEEVSAMSDFLSYVYVLDSNGEEHEIPVKISYDATYEKEYISGPPEDCYPATGEMDLTGISIYDLPFGITDEMVLAQVDLAKDRLEQEAWDDFFQGDE